MTGALMGSSRSGLSLIVLAIIGGFQFFSSIVLVYLTCKKNDFPKVYTSYTFFTIMFHVGFLATIFMIPLSVLVDDLHFMILIAYIIYYIIEFNITNIVYSFTKELGNENFEALDKEKSSNETNATSVTTTSNEDTENKIDIDDNPAARRR